MDGAEVDGAEVDGTEVDGAEMDGAEVDGAEMKHDLADGVEAFLIKADLSGLKQIAAFLRNFNFRTINRL